MIVTPDGRIARYFYGIDFPPRELQAELERARAGRIGSPIGRLLLLCYDYDAATGKYTLSILRLLRVLGTATALGLGGFLFVMFRREGTERRISGHGTRSSGSGRADRPRLSQLAAAEARIMWNFPFFPEQASTMARQVDAVYLFELCVAGFFTVLICVLIITFAARYRQKANVDRSRPPTANKFWK